MDWRENLDPELVVRILWLLWAADQVSYPLRVSSAYRSTEKQAQLYADWIARGKTGLPVAKPGTSLHEVGRAVDVAWAGSTPFPGLKGQPEPFPGAWEALGAYAKRYLGLAWRSSDPVHFAWVD